MLRNAKIAPKEVVAVLQEWQYVLLIDAVSMPRLSLSTVCVLSTVALEWISLDCELDVHAIGNSLSLSGAGQITSGHGP